MSVPAPLCGVGAGDIGIPRVPASRRYDRGPTGDAGLLRLLTLATVPEQKTRRLPRWLPYTVLRLLFFAVPLGVVYALGENITLAAVAAAIIGLCLSVIFLGPQRAAAAEVLEARTRRRLPHPTDEDLEDAEDAAGGAAGADQNASAAARPKP